MKKRFGGLNLSEIAASTGAAPPPADAPPKVPIAELALRGRSTHATERQILILADPARCRGWKYHNRHNSWFTESKCSDLIHAIGAQGQQEPALGRRIEGDPDFDFELIYGMRRRFACAFLGKKLKLVITDCDDRTASIVMHQENADRKDITPMERAISYADQLRDGVFKSQEEIALALDVSKGRVSQMLMAAELLSEPVIASLFADPTVIPIKNAYDLAAYMKKHREVVVSAAQKLSSNASTMTPTAILKFLLKPPSTKQSGELRKQYNVGSTGRMVLTRNRKGKVTLAFPGSLTRDMEEDAVAAFRVALKDL